MKSASVSKSARESHEAIWFASQARASSRSTAWTRSWMLIRLSMALPGRQQDQGGLLGVDGVLRRPQRQQEPPDRLLLRPDLLAEVEQLRAELHGPRHARVYVHRPVSCSTCSIRSRILVRRPYSQPITCASRAGSAFIRRAVSSSSIRAAAARRTHGAIPPWTLHTVAPRTLQALQGKPSVVRCAVHGTFHRTRPAMRTVS